MPNCFELTRIGDTKASSLAHIDDCICQHFEVASDPELYHHGWYDFIGFLLAVGRSWDDIADACTHKATPWATHMRAIVHYLRQHYTAEAWWEPR